MLRYVSLKYPKFSESQNSKMVEHVRSIIHWTVKIDSLCKATSHLLVFHGKFEVFLNLGVQKSAIGFSNRNCVAVRSYDLCIDASNAM
jgi:hypothetical protein